MNEGCCLILGPEIPLGLDLNQEKIHSTKFFKCLPHARQFPRIQKNWTWPQPSLSPHQTNKQTNNPHVFDGDTLLMLKLQWMMMMSCSINICMFHEELEGSFLALQSEKEMALVPFSKWKCQWSLLWKIGQFRVPLTESYSFALPHRKVVSVRTVSLKLWSLDQQHKHTEFYIFYGI